MNNEFKKLESKLELNKGKSIDVMIDTVLFSNMYEKFKGKRNVVKAIKKYNIQKYRDKYSVTEVQAYNNINHVRALQGLELIEIPSHERSLYVVGSKNE